MWLRGCLLLALAGVPVGLPASAVQATSADPAVAEGVRLVETGEYDAAILTLDNAARRLAADPAKVRELSRAYLYLGIAYLGKGHEAAARAKFREAVAKVHDLTLSPEEFPPKVIDLFEAARAEANAGATAAATPAAAPAAAAPAKKGGSKTLLIVGGVGGAAAVAGIALAGGGGSSSGTSTPVATPTPAPTTTEDLSGFLPFTEGSRHFTIKVRGTGTLVAELSWTVPTGQDLELVMQLFADGRDVAISNRTTPTAAVLRADVTARDYDLSVFYAGQCPGCETQFRLMVTHP